MPGVLPPEGWALLAALPPYEQLDVLAVGERLRAGGADPALVAAVLTQSRLRSRARAKLGAFADGMLFTAEGLEQATRLQVAARHAQRFAGAGVARVADLGCGIGVDAMALAGLDRQVLAVERDPGTAAVAAVNLRHFPDAVVRCEDATTTDLSGVDGAFLDPARRAGGRRVLQPERWSPPYSFALALAERLPAVGVKAAPGLDRDAAPPGAELQWVSVDGEVVECAVWCGPLARPGVRRSALVLRGERAAEVVDGGMPEAEVGPVGPVLVEPDGAVVRAGLVAALAAEVGGRLLDPTIAYLTADAPPSTPLGRALGTAYAVHEVLPFSLKRLRAVLRARGAGPVVVKKRGSAVDVDDLRRRLRLDGDREATVVLTRVAGAPTALVVERLALANGEC